MTQYKLNLRKTMCRYVMYLKCKYTEHRAEQQALVRGVAQQHFQSGPVRRSYPVIRAARGCK